MIYTRSDDEVSRLDFFKSFTKVGVDYNLLRTKMSVAEQVTQLLQAVQKVIQDFKSCHALLTLTELEQKYLHKFDVLCNQLTDFEASLLVWLRLELAGRIYLGFREVTKTDFSLLGHSSTEVKRGKEGKLTAETSI